MAPPAASSVEVAAGIVASLFATIVSTTKVCIQCGTVYDVGQKFCPNDGSPLRLQSPEDPLIGQVVADRYQMISLIGEGGMGRVYCAEHVRMGRKSAVKVINPALATTPDAIARFNREAENACRINHPNVAQVYDFGEMADGTLYLAMEYVDGETLDTVIAREGSLPLDRAAQITKQVADALFAAHHLGIVHRDLKPENVMLARHLDGTDWVKVVDFGIAKTVQRDGGGSQTVTTAGVSLGTPEYMSPEQLAGERLDHRTDVYSLGLVLFNMLTGELPYPKVTSKETLVRRLTSKPRTLAEVRPDVAWPPGLQEALDRAVAPEVADRYESVAQLGRDVVAAVAAAPSAAAAAGGARVVSGAAPVAPESAHEILRTSDEVVPEKAPARRRRALRWVVAAAVSLLSVGAIFAATRGARDELNPNLEPNVAATRDTEHVGGEVGHPASAITRVEIPQPPVGAAPRAQANAQATVRGDTSIAAAQRGLHIGDSIAHALAGAGLGRLANLDSIMRAIGPQIDRARREAQRDAQRRAAIVPNRHFWLRADGDSAAARPLPRNAPMEERIAAAGAEIRAHIARMRRFADDDNVRAARVEFTNASAELTILHDLAPEAALPGALEEELNHSVRDAIVACYRRISDSTVARAAQCENLVAAPSPRLWNPQRPDPVPR